MTDDIQRTIVVTGGSRGIGRAVCEAFAGAGAFVVFNYRSAGAEADITCDRVAARGGTARGIQADLADESEVAGFFKQIVDETGRIDVLVNNAGITRDGLVVRMSDAQWHEVLDVNLTGTFYCIKYAAKTMMRQRYGRIVNLSSVVGVAGNPGQANYVASKAGIIGLTKSVAQELASRGITVNAVAPGYIDTDMTSALPEKAKQALLDAIPMGSIGSPEDVAAAVVFLASDPAKYITGQVIHVNGGLYM